MSGPTQEQRKLIRSLRRELEFDPVVLTFMDRRAAVGEKWIGKRVDAWMDSLSVSEASAMIKRLQGMLS